MKKIDFIYFDAGGGHRAAATALKAVVELQERPWDIRLVHLQEVLASMDVFRKITGIPLEDIYNLMLAKGWTLGSAQGLQFMHAVIQAYHGPTVRLLARHWEETRPDMVVSLVPNFNRAMYDALRASLGKRSAAKIPAAKIPYVTVLTDFADFPPHFWMEKGQDQYFICGTDRAVGQARALGYSRERIFQTSGMILRPTFYNEITVDRASELKRLGLDSSVPTGLVLFGGQGSKVMLEIAERLPDTQLIFICGRNQKLAERLKALPTRAAHYVEGFTQEVPYYMHLADFFIGKPGPGSISEAVAMKLPVIVERNAWTLPQERYNADWVTEHHAGMVVSSFRGIEKAVAELLGALASYRASVSQTHNRAVFEIPEIIDGILQRS